MSQSLKHEWTSYAYYRMSIPVLTFKIVAVSNISAMKVDTPFNWLSPAPTRARIESNIQSSASVHGTKQPTWAISAMTPICVRILLMQVTSFRCHMRTYLTDICWFAAHVRARDDLKFRLVLQGVSQQEFGLMITLPTIPRIISTSLGINTTSSCTSRQGWRASFKITPPSPGYHQLSAIKCWEDNNTLPCGCIRGRTYCLGAVNDTSAKLSSDKGIVHRHIRWSTLPQQYIQMS